MKKYFTCILITSCLFLLSACGHQEEDSDTIRNRIADNTYIYEKEGFGGDFTIRLNSDGTFSYYEGNLSSLIGMGNWKLEEDVLILSHNLPDNESAEYSWVNYFQINGNDLVFLSKDSTNFHYVTVSDGERFSASSR